MTHAKLCWQSAVYRSFLIACLAVLIAVLLPPAGQAQQSSVPQTCEVQTKSCCNTCGSCDPGPSCPAGYTIYDDYCLPECPTGYLRYPGYPGLCLPPCTHGCPEGYDAVPLPSCPEGYHRDLSNPDECLPDRSLQIPDNCPEGLSYSDETGRCSPDCPEGTYLAENGLCRSYYDRACPDGYQRNERTGQCVPGGDWPDDYKWICLPSCPQGFTRDIYHPTRCLPPPETCPFGFENFRQQCVPVCEQGTTRNAYGYCLPPRCEDGSYPNLRGVCSPPSCPEGYETIRGKCHAPCPQGLVRNPNNPAQCERIPEEEPECPEDTRLNPQTNECERVPPPPPPTVNCKQGLEYNPKTKKCEPPPRVETTCPRGFTKLKNGRCQRIVEEPPEEQGCPRGFVLNRNTGECEPVRLNVPKACPEGTLFDRKRQRCVRVVIEREPEFEPEDDGQPTLRLPKIDLNNNLLNQQKRCPKGMAPDKNGRCVPLQ
jgi:hypothetical protein